ncbi:MAG: hypothetical protein ACN4EH_10325, partial [Methyloceanibacter sp.]
SGNLLRLRFVAAVSASCSGDKSDKEESAGGFLCYGDFVLPARHSRTGLTAALVMQGANRLASMI